MNVGVCGAGIFALLDCLPGMAFTLTLFRKRLRLGVRATVAVCALLVVIQVVAGSLRYRHVDDNAYMALMAILLPVLWGFPVIGLIRDSWRKIVFVLMLFMNLSGTVTVMGNAVDRHLFPGGGVYDWRYLLTVLLVGIALICVLFVFFGRTLLDLFDVEDADYIWRYLWLVPAGFSAIALWMRFGTPEPEYISTAKPANFMMLMLFVMSLRCCRCWLRRTSLANCVITSPRWYEPFLQVRGTVLPVIRNWMHCCSITRMRRNALGSGSRHESRLQWTTLPSRSI